MIRLKNFDVSYPNHHCFNIEEIELKQGFAYLVVGPNGAGKSSFLKKLGFSQSTYSYISFPEFGLLTFNSVIENLNFFANRLNFSSEDLSWIKNNLLKMQINMNDKVSILSQGQSQFVKFLIVMRFSSPLLCLDELFNYFDQDFYNIVYDILKVVATKKIILISATIPNIHFTHLLVIKDKSLVLNIKSENLC